MSVFKGHYQFAFFCAFVITHLVLIGLVLEENMHLLVVFQCEVLFLYNALSLHLVVSFVTLNLIAGVANRGTRRIRVSFLL